MCTLKGLTSPAADLQQGHAPEETGSLWIREPTHTSAGPWARTAGCFAPALAWERTGCLPSLGTGEETWETEVEVNVLACQFRRWAACPESRFGADSFILSVKRRTNSSGKFLNHVPVFTQKKGLLKVHLFFFFFFSILTKDMFL